MANASIPDLELAEIQSGALRPRPSPYAATHIGRRIDDRKAGREVMRRALGVVNSAADENTGHRPRFPEKPRVEMPNPHPIHDFRGQYTYFAQIPRFGATQCRAVSGAWRGWHLHKPLRFQLAVQDTGTSGVRPCQETPDREAPISPGLPRPQDAVAETLKPRPPGPTL